MMRFTVGVATVAVAVVLGGGCHLFDGKLRRHPKAEPPTFSQYHLDGWDWSRVDRVLVLPFLNESSHTRAGDEARAAFTSELQRMGRFEVVNAPSDDKAVLAAQIHRGGRFDEAAMLEVARATSADVVVHGIVTQYSPYHPRPRLGLIIQAVSPQQAKVVSSVDGVWDTTDSAIAERCRTYYRQRVRPLPPWIRNHVIASDDSFAGELALDSPALFQRWVCHESVLTLLGLPVPGVLSSSLIPQLSANSGPDCTTVTSQQSGTRDLSPAKPGFTAAPSDNAK